MTRSLADFLRLLERQGELRRITDATSPLVEVSRLADAESKSPAPQISQHARTFDGDHCDLGGKALLFDNIAGCDFPLCINVFGSYFRMELAMGCHETGGFEAIARRIASLAQPKPPRSLGEMISKAREFLPLLRIPPRRVRFGPCQEVVRLTSRNEVNLLRLPLIQCWPLDGDPRAVGYDISPQEAGTARGEGRYITFAGMHTIHADDRDDPKPASHNIGMYRAQLMDETHLAMHWHMHHDGAAHWRSWKRLGEPMPLAICFGGESVLPYAATAPLPPGLSELLMAGFLNGRGIPLVRARTIPIRVPANSEIVIEGFVSTECGFPGYDPRIDKGGLGPGAAFEGPFGDHTGFYSLPDRYPIMTVTAITHRRDAVFPATIVGPPPQEDYYLGKATERIFLPLLQTLIPDIRDYHLPMFGCFHNCAFVQIDKQYPLQARRVMHAIWGAGQMAWTKVIVVVDADVNVHDERAVLRAVATNCRFDRDCEFVNGPLDILDHAAPCLGAGGKLGIDATKKIRGEEVHGVRIDAPIVHDGDAQEHLRQCIGSAGVAGIAAPDFGRGRIVFAGVNKTQSRQGAGAIEAVWKATDESSGIADLLIAVQGAVNLDNWQDVLFHWCANFDPSRDTHSRGRRIAFDATTKLPGDERNHQPVRDYPPVLSFD